MQEKLINANKPRSLSLMATGPFGSEKAISKVQNALAGFFMKEQTWRKLINLLQVCLSKRRFLHSSVLKPSFRQSIAHQYKAMGHNLQTSWVKECGEILVWLGRRKSDTQKEAPLQELFHANLQAHVAWPRGIPCWIPCQVANKPQPAAYIDTQHCVAIGVLSIIIDLQVCQKGTEAAVFAEQNESGRLGRY